MDIQTRERETRVVSVVMSTLLDDLTNALAVKPRPPDSVTARELSNSTGRGYNACKDYLDKLVMRGESLCEFCIVNGKRVMVYWKRQGE